MKMDIVKNLFTKNIPLKLVSLIVAALLWFYVVTEKKYEYSTFFHLKAENLDKKYIWTTTESDSIEVKLAGPGKSLLKLMMNERNVYFDASSYNPEKGNVLYRKIEIDENRFEIPYEDIEIVDILQPKDKKVPIHVQMIDQRMIPIASRLEIIPGSGFFVSDDIEFTPEDVLVIGPTSKLKTIDSIYTMQETFDDIRRTTTKTVMLDTTLEDVKFEERYVSAYIPIDHLAYKNFRQIPVELRGFPSGFQVIFDPRTVNVTVSGSSGAVERVGNNDIRVIIDYKQLTPEGSNKIEPIISHPPNVSISGKEPKYIQIKESSDFIKEVTGNK
ncbi:MAG: YbbR-like domain-containing protein [Candidatus Zixiibacteriota bacterium]